MVDDITDIQITDELDFAIGSDNDLQTTKYEDTPLQSVFIHAKNAIQPYIGRRVDREVLESLADAVSTEISDTDPQIQSVEEVNVSYSKGFVEITVYLIFNDEFRTVEITQEL